MCFVHKNTSKDLHSQRIRIFGEGFALTPEQKDEAIKATKFKNKKGWKRINKKNPLWGLIFVFLYEITVEQRFPKIKKTLLDCITQIYS